MYKWYKIFSPKQIPTISKILFSYKFKIYIFVHAMVIILKTNEGAT